MSQENKADEDPFTTHNIGANDQNLLIGAAARNNDNEMDIILNTNYSTLQPLERIAVKNHAAQQARAQAASGGSNDKSVFDTTSKEFAEGVKKVMAPAVVTLAGHSQGQSEKHASTKHDLKTVKENQETDSKETQATIKRMRLENDLRELKRDKTTKLGLNLTTFLTYCFALIVGIISLVRAILGSHNDGVVIIELGCYILSLILYVIISEYPAGVVKVMHFFRWKSFTEKKTWMVNRIRNSFFYMLNGLLALTVNVGNINQIASIICIGMSLVLGLLLAWFSFQSTRKLDSNIDLLEKEIEKIRDQEKREVSVAETEAHDIPAPIKSGIGGTKLKQGSKSKSMSSRSNELAAVKSDFEQYTNGNGRNKYNGNDTNGSSTPTSR